MAAPAPETHLTAEEWKKLTERLEPPETGAAGIQSLLSARPVHRDRKTLRREKEKKIVLGNKRATMRNHSTINSPCE